VNNIDEQYVAGVEKLEQLGYTFAGEWHPANDASVADLEGSAMRCALSPGGRDRNLGASTCGSRRTFPFEFGRRCSHLVGTHSG